jgi:WD40 repeat protein
VRFLNYLPDGRLLSVGGGSASIWIWEPGAKQPSRKLPSSSGILAISTTFDGKLIAARTANSRIPVWEEATSKLLSRMIWHAPTTSELIFLPNSHRLCVASWNGLGEYEDPTLTSVEFRRSDRIWAVNSAHYLSVAVSPSGRHMLSTLATSGGEALAEVASFDRHEDLRQTLSTPDRLFGKIRFFQEENILFATQKDGPLIWVWDRKEWQHLQTLEAHNLPVSDLLATPDGQNLLSCSADGTVAIWDLPNGKLLRQFDWGIGAVTAMAIAPDGLTWTIGGERGDIVTCDFE